MSWELLMSIVALVIVLATCGYVVWAINFVRLTNEFRAVKDGNIDEFSIWMECRKTKDWERIPYQEQVDRYCNEYWKRKRVFEEQIKIREEEYLRNLNQKKKGSKPG